MALLGGDAANKPLLPLRSGLRSAKAEQKKSAVANVVEIGFVVHAQGQGAERTASQRLRCERNEEFTTEEQVDWATEIAFHFRSEASVTGLDMDLLMLLTS